MIFLFDRDGRKNAVDEIDIGFVHAIKKLPNVGRKCLHIATLAFGIERVESERRFSRTRWTSDHRESVVGDVEVERLQIVLSGSFDANDG